MAARIIEAEFLKRAKQRFGEQFDYSAMRWRSYKSPVKIRCRHHPVQEISITLEKHLQTLAAVVIACESDASPHWSANSTASPLIAAWFPAPRRRPLKLTRW